MRGGRRTSRPRATGAAVATGTPQTSRRWSPCGRCDDRGDHRNPVSWGSSPCATTRSRSSTWTSSPAGPVWPTPPRTRRGRRSIRARPGVAGRRRRQPPRRCFYERNGWSNAGALDNPAPTPAGDAIPVPALRYEKQLAASGQPRRRRRSTGRRPRPAGRPAPRTDDGNQTTGGQGRPRHGRHPRIRPRDRRRTGRGGRHRVLHRAHHGLATVGDERPETIEETAALVDAAGGRGIAVRVDHLVPDEVAALSTASGTSRASCTCWSTTSGAPPRWRNATVWSPTSSTASTCCAWRSTPTPSPATSPCRCSSSGPAVSSSR